MYYCLASDIALRSWLGVEHGYFSLDGTDAFSLPNAYYELLSQCDGLHELEETPRLAALLRMGLIAPCERGDVIQDWQRHRVCDNYPFPALNWAITDKCNYNCRHCFMAAGSAGMTDEFGWEDCVRLMDGMEECGIWRVSLTGGEPMLHPRFMDIISSLTRRHMRVFEIATNGAFITSEMLDEFSALGQRPLMKISFDGLGWHDWMRQRAGAEERTLAAIRLCVARDLPVRLQINVHPDNLSAMPATLETMDALGVNEARVIRTSESPRWLENGGHSLNLIDYYDSMLELAKMYIAKPRRMKLRLWQFLEIFPEQRAYHCRPIRCLPGNSADDMPVCVLNRKMVSVAGDGEIVPCNQLSGALKLNGTHYGNVITDGLQTLLRGGAYLDAVSMTGVELKHHSSECTACEYWSLCGGGCRALALALTGDINGRDPAKCTWFQHGYMERIREAFDSAGEWHSLDKQQK